MKKLLLIRHANAVDHSEHGDFARALSEKGKKAALATAGYLQQHQLLPQYILCSPALRTTTTAQIISEILHLPAPQFDQNIYDASEQTLLKVINDLNNENNFSALVGHNPGIAYLLYSLSGEVRDVPPGTAIVLTFEVQEWAAISAGTGTITHYFAP